MQITISLLITLFSSHLEIYDDIFIENIFYYLCNYKINLVSFRSPIRNVLLSSDE